MTLEEKIKAMLAEQDVSEAKKCKEEKMDDDTESEEDEVDVNPKMKKEETEDQETALEVSEEITTESEKATVSEQVTALLESEGLSEEFKNKATAIFEAAVADKVLQLQEEMQAAYDEDLEEAKTELANMIDGYVTEAVLQWVESNKVEMQASFKSKIAESFVDGLRQLFVEHNIEVPEDKVDAYELALDESVELSTQVERLSAEVTSLQESLNSVNRARVLESYKSQMSMTEFDRFSTLVESIKFESEEQFKGQLEVVKENFGTKQATVKQVGLTESTEVNKDPLVSKFAEYINKTAK